MTTPSSATSVNAASGPVRSHKVAVNLESGAQAMAWLLAWSVMREPEEKHRTPKPGTESVEVKPKGARITVSPTMFHRWSGQNLKASRVVEEGEGAQYSPVRASLVCHALELALKAFLLTKGWVKKRLKNDVGHDLVKALEAAKQEGLNDCVNLTTGEVKAIRAVSELFGSKQFHYFEDFKGLLNGFKGRPNCQVLDDVCQRILNGIEGTINQSV